MPHTTPSTKDRQLKTNAEQRFWAKVSAPDPNGCRNYQGAIERGYGRFWIDGRTAMAHRVAWELTNGPIPEGKQLDHLCRNRSCINPEHLEPVTIEQNVLRGEGITALNARKTHCTHGHELTEDNTYIRPDRGTRACIKCQRAGVRKHRKNQKETKAA